jgi:hypothetical protein
MGNLSATQMDAIRKVVEKPQLQSYFFMQASGLKWFDEFKKQGFFDPESSPKSGDWPILIYLEKTAHELEIPANNLYNDEYLKFIRSVSTSKQGKPDVNTRTWWYLAKFLKFIPTDRLLESDIEHFKLWLSSPDKMLVGLELGEQLLPRLLQDSQAIKNKLAEGLLELFLDIEWLPAHYDRSRKEPRLVLDDYWANQVFKTIAPLVGKNLGINGLQLILSALKEVLNSQSNDKTSFIWRPAIEDHDQNKEHEDPENLLITLFRDALLSLDFSNSKSKEYALDLLNSELLTLQRMAFFLMGEKRSEFIEELGDVVAERYFEKPAVHHELYHFLQKSYRFLDESKKLDVLDWINKTSEGSADPEADEETQSKQNAYGKLRLLSAIKGQGFNSADELYQSQLEITSNNEPDHPDFYIYSSGAEWIGEQSPLSSKDLLELSIPDLIKQLKTFEPAKTWNAPTKYGLNKALREAILSKTGFIKGNLNKFISLSLVYISAVLEAYRDLWKKWKTNGDPNIPPLFPEVLCFIEELISNPDFWQTEPAADESGFKVGIDWVVGDIAQLISELVSPDESAIDAKHNEQLLEIISSTLDKINGDDFESFNDAISISINSARGKSIEAFIDLSLRMCRLAEQQNGSHKECWENDLKPTYESLCVSGRLINNFEFYALFVHRWSNFRFLDLAWTESKLPEVFNPDDPKTLNIALQGFSYLGQYDKTLFNYLRRQKIFVQALESDDFPKEVSKRIIQFAFIAYLGGDDDLMEPEHILHFILRSKDFEVLSKLIWFVWTLRSNLKLPEQREKVFKLWEEIINSIGQDDNSNKILGKLGKWTAYVKSIDSRLKALLMKSAPFICLEFSENFFIEELHRLAKDNPDEVSEVFLKLLEHCVPTYMPEDVLGIIKIIKETDSTKFKEVTDRYIEANIGFINKIREAEREWS